MSIERRGDRYRVRMRRQGWEVSASFPSRVEAERFRAEWLEALDLGRDLPAPPAPESPVALASVPTIEEAAREWSVGAVRGVVKARRGRPYREGSIATHEYRLRLHVLPYLGRVPVSAVTPGTVRRWLEDLEAATTATTARTALDSLRVVLRRLVDLEVLAVNPCSGVRPPVRDGEARIVRFLTPEEGERVREAAYHYRDPLIGPFVDLALATGARRGELLAATWGQGGLDLEAQTLTVAGSRRPASDRVGPTKSGGTRVVPIGARVAARLREARMAVGRPGDGELVLPFDPRPRWVRVRGIVGDPSPTIHDLRHSAATWWLAGGLTVHEVAALLGHASPTLVIRRYGHALPDRCATAGERLEAFLGNRA